jgi:hypothetical protein
LQIVWKPLLRGFSPPIPVLSALKPTLKFFNPPPPPKKFLGTPLQIYLSQKVNYGGTDVDFRKRHKFLSALLCEDPIWGPP